MTPLVLIPGMMCDARMWGVVPAALGPRPMHHALPVMGETIAQMAEASLQDAPAEFALAGLSMGGIVAMEMLRQAPARITRLALLDTNPLPEVPAVRARRAPQIARVLAGDLDSVMQDELKPNYLADPSDRPILDLCLDMARKLGPDVFRRQSLALMNRVDQTDILRRFTGPALVLMGAQDRLCRRDRHELMHNLMPQSELIIIADAGHLPPLEQPAPTIAAFKTWLQQ